MPQIVAAFHAVSPVGIKNCIFTFYIYPDRFTVQFELFTNGQLSLSSNSYEEHWIGFNSIDSSQINVSGDNNVETSAGNWGAAPDANYIGVTATNITHKQNNIYRNTASGSPSVSQSFFGAGRGGMGFYNSTIGTADTSETHVYVCEFIIDSEDREHGSKLYNETNRLTMGGQYKDQTLSLTAGTAKTDLTDPLSIGTYGFASDGAWHMEMS